MRTRYDQFAKLMSRCALEDRGIVQTEVEVSSEPRRLDFWFTPREDVGPVPPHLGLFGRVTGAASTVEFFHRTPSGDELTACLFKHGAFRHGLSLRDEAVAAPILWVISAGRPNDGIANLWFRPLAGWPSGFYEGPPLLWVRLIVVSELPVTRDTLLLRLLGAGRVLREAVGELKGLPRDALDRRLALPFVLELRVDMSRDRGKLTQEDEEFLMETQDVVEMWRQEAAMGGRVEGRIEGRIEGRVEGRELGLRFALIAVYRGRFGKMPDDIRAVIEDTHDQSTLDAWVIRIGSVESAAEIDAEIRARSTGIAAH